MEDIEYKILATGYQLSDPKLYDVLHALNQNVVELNRTTDELLALIRTVQDFVSMPY